ncbi:MAG: choline kinase [Flavobacteriales bacterium]|nr:MAG: choline kinase [Flavobacteriales bacterium]
MSSIKQTILNITKATNAEEIEHIQTLWSGYGNISRYALTGSNLNTVIVKNIIYPNQTNHPRGWNTAVSHQRKVKSYQVETEWYKSFSDLCNDDCRIPKCYGTENIGEEQVIVLEDLDAAGFPVRKSDLTKDEVKICLKWLANFHATFLNIKPEGLWGSGTYWHLATRPDEFATMNDTPLKQVASEIDEILSNSKFQTLVHGDAKVANFCFSEDMLNVAAVDFQYVGGGCGMKDVAYLLGSCLTENECEVYESELLDFYFLELKSALNIKGIESISNKLEQEWRALYSIAWADFTRFLMGWMPTHQKLNAYSKLMVEKALNSIKKEQ